jgi:hypothetical protein
MLKILKNVAAAAPVVEKPVVPMVQISQEAFDFMLSHLPDQSPIALQRETKAELTALIDAIEQFGLSRALLSFADHNGLLRGAVPSIPSLEALAADMSVEESGAVLQALKDINNGIEPAQENVFTLIFLTAIFGYLGGWIPALVAAGVYTVWAVATHAAKDGEEHTEHHVERVASVIHYDTLMGYLTDLIEVPSIFEQLENSKLPNTEIGHQDWLRRLSQSTSHLAKLGIHVKPNGDITTSDLESPSTTNIEHVGYTEHSLKNISEAAKHMSAVEAHLKSFSVAKLEKQEKEATGEEKKYVTAAGGTIGELIHVTSTRMLKILHLTKQTVTSIEHFYAKG